jgi:hypothetical protein
MAQAMKNVFHKVKLGFEEDDENIPSQRPDGRGLLRRRRREYSIPKGQMVRAFGKILHDVKLGFEEEEAKQERTRQMSSLHWRHCRAEGIWERGSR